MSSLFHPINVIAMVLMCYIIGYVIKELFSFTNHKDAISEDGGEKK